MRKTAGVIMAMAIWMQSAAAQTLQPLPSPETTGGMPVLQAMAGRRSTRSFGDKAVDEQTLSNILWAAYGENRADGRRTIPTALNEQDLAVYVAKSDGVWLYDAHKNALQPVAEENILPLFNRQDYMAKVPLVLIYVGSDDERGFAAMHAGSAYQNVGLYAASAGLADVVRGYFDHDAVGKALNLPQGQKVIISQAVGWAE